MRKTKILLAVYFIAAFFLTSCEDDDIPLLMPPPVAGDEQPDVVKTPERAKSSSSASPSFDFDEAKEEDLPFKSMNKVAAAKETKQKETKKEPKSKSPSFDDMDDMPFKSVADAPARETKKSAKTETIKPKQEEQPKPVEPPKQTKQLPKNTFVPSKTTKNAEPAPVAAPATNLEQKNSGSYTIQVAIFPNEAEAKTLVNSLKQNGVTAYYRRTDNPGKLVGSYYRVRVGYFDGISGAERFARNILTKLGYTDWWVDKASNDNKGYKNS